MGSIFVLEGLMIYLYGFDHNPPHIYVKGGADDFSITIKDRIVEGKAKSKSVALINSFIDLNEDKIMEIWEKAQRGERIEKIKR